MKKIELKILHFLLLLFAGFIFTKLSFDALVLGAIVLVLIQND